MHLFFWQPIRQVPARPALSAVPAGKSRLRPDSLYFSIAIAAGFLWLALNCF